MRYPIQGCTGTYRAATGDRVTLIFDGDDGVGFISGAGRQQGIEVVFSRPPESAGDVMIGRIGWVCGKKAMLVVLKDREIQRAARRNRVAMMKSEAFEEEMARRVKEGPQKFVLEQAVDMGDVAF